MISEHVDSVYSIGHRRHVALTLQGCAVEWRQELPGQFKDIPVIFVQGVSRNLDVSGAELLAECIHSFTVV